jgi:hypothetical protein
MKWPIAELDAYDPAAVQPIAGTVLVEVATRATRRSGAEPWHPAESETTIGGVGRSSIACGRVVRGTWKRGAVTPGTWILFTTFEATSVGGLMTIVPLTAILGIVRKA